MLVVAVSAFVAGAAHVGFGLFGAIRQIDGLVGATAGTADSAFPSTVESPASGIEAPAVPPAAVRVPEAPSEVERDLRFDADAAAREAADRDSNVAELLNDPDPAVGSAVRDFITSLAAPGNR